MARSRPVDVLCIYRIKRGKEAAFRKLLRKHGPTLRAAGLSGARAPTIWKSRSRAGGTVFLELMQWKDATSSAAAHQRPEVMAVWEPMGRYATAMEFLDLEPAGI
jgi:hypothetical protein